MEKELKRLKIQIENNAIKYGRNINDISIVAVTKSFPPGIWDKALKHQLNIIGESKIQEVERKNEKFKNRKNIELHLIGHLQRNKARKAVELFDVIQTIDSIKLATKINLISNELQKIQKIFLQVKIIKDPDKYGFQPNKIIEAAKQIVKMKNISVIGLMTIPPQNISEEKILSIYNRAKYIRDIIKKSIDKNCCNLSMGMSNDFNIAISAGATHLRIGTELFGKRPNDKFFFNKENNLLN